MTFEEYWNATVGQDLEDSYTGLLAQLNKDRLSDELLDEFDLPDLMIEIIYGLVKKRQHERIIALLDLIKRTQSERMLATCYPWFFDALTNYFCFKRQEEDLRNLIKGPLEIVDHFDVYNQNLKEMAHYGHLDLVDQIVDNHYDAVATEEELSGGAETDFKIVKFYTELDGVVRHYKARQEFDFAKLKSAIPKYGFTLDEAWIDKIQHALSTDPSDLAPMYRQRHKEDQFSTKFGILHTSFSYLLDYGINVYSAQRMWEILLEYWEENNAQKNGSDYFRINPKSFKLHLRSQSGMMLDYRFESVLTLWGSEYIYDYLFKLGLIEEKFYADTLGTIGKLKALLIQENRNDLWRYSFIHLWRPSARQTNESQAAERAVFEQYFDEPYKGKAAKGFFLRTEKEVMAHVKALGIRPNSTFAKEKKVDAAYLAAQKSPPKKTIPKLGRNDKVTVKYEDGTVKKDIKFKNVLKDLEAGKCELV